MCSMFSGMRFVNIGCNFAGRSFLSAWPQKCLSGVFIERHSMFQAKWLFEDRPYGF